MKRSLILFIAEELTRSGAVTHLKDAVDHMDKKLYSCVTYHKHSTQSYFIVTVVFSDEVMIIYSVDTINETIKTISQIGLLH